MARRRADLLACLALTALWWLPALWIGVSGEFPINDDWAYAHTVQVLIETGHFERPAWTWAPSLTNVGIGALFAWLLGFSHAVLRLCSLTLGWLAVLASFGLARTVGCAVGGALLAAATLAVNPLFVNLAHSFMTDVGFTALCVGALWAGAHALQGPRPTLGLHGRSWGLAALLAVAAILSRQPGLMLPAAAGGALLLLHRREPRVWLASGALVVLGLALYAALPLLYGSGDSGRHMRVLWYLQHRVLSRGAFYHVAVALLSSGAVLGLSLLPLLARVRASPRRLALATAFAGLLLALALRLGLTAPLHLNLLRSDLGLGPMTLPDAPSPPAWGPALWWALDGLGLFATGVLGIALLASQRRLHRRPDLWMLLLFPALCLAVLGFQSPYFDRWVLPFVPPLAVALVAVLGGPVSPSRRASSVALLGALGLWAWLGTADTLAHYRARARVLDGLLAQGISADRIDGGFEFNGVHHFARNDRDWSRFKEKPGSRWVVDDEYVVTLSPELPGYERLSETPVRRRLPPGEQPIYVLRRRPIR